MSTYGINNCINIVTSDDKRIPYLKSTLTGMSNTVDLMIKDNVLRLEFSERVVSAFLTWIDKTTIEDNPFITSYKTSLEKSAKDKAEIVKLAKFISMKEPEMMMDFIYESFSESSRTNEYKNKNITCNDFFMYASKQDIENYDYDSCILMLSDIVGIRKLADERLKTPNYEKVFQEQVMDKAMEKRMQKYHEEQKKKDERVVPAKQVKRKERDLFDDIEIKIA